MEHALSTATVRLKTCEVGSLNSGGAYIVGRTRWPYNLFLTNHNSSRPILNMMMMMMMMIMMKYRKRSLKGCEKYEYNSTWH